MARIACNATSDISQSSAYSFQEGLILLQITLSPTLSLTPSKCT